MDTLTRMRAFIDVVEAEGFSAAARKIGRSKALLSKYVRELEDELGALLLNRTTRQFSLTEAGHTYYRRASEIVREVDSLADAVRESSGDVRGRIKLSAPRTFADAPIGQSLVDFAKQYPEIVLDIHLDDRFVDLVEEGFDLAVRISRLENSSLIARRLAPFSVRLCASPELIAKHGAPARPQDLANMPCIVDTNGRSLANWRFALVPGFLKRRRARLAAREQFLAQGLHRTRRRTGLLIYVAEAERYAEIIADDGLAGVADETFWRDRMAALAQALRERRAAEGLVACIEACAPRLAEAAPRAADDRNELPNRVVML